MIDSVEFEHIFNVKVVQSICLGKNVSSPIVVSIVKAPPSSFILKHTGYFLVTGHRDSMFVIAPTSHHTLKDPKFAFIDISLTPPFHLKWTPLLTFQKYIVKLMRCMIIA